MSENRILLVAVLLLFVVAPVFLLLNEIFPRSPIYIGHEFPEVSEELIERAEAGDPESQYELGGAYGSSSDGDYDVLDEKAAYWLLEAAEGGHADAQNEVGYFYRKGIFGQEKDIQMALEWFHTAATQGEVLAHINLAQIYREGDGVARDDAVSTEHFKIAAEAGYPPAQFEYGIRLKEGVGIEQHAVEGWWWVSKAKLYDFGARDFLEDELSAVDMKFENLAPVSAIGYRVSRSGASWAKETFALASSAEQPPDIFLMDIGWDDPELHYELFRSAALLGHSGAQYELGKRSQSGLGVDQNAAEAQYWFGRAAAQGHTKASVALMQPDTDMDSGSSPE